MTEDTLTWRESLAAARAEATGRTAGRTGGADEARAGTPGEEAHGGKLLFVELFDPG